MSRSIPACAGEPQERKAWPVGLGVYPRVCGGTPYAHRGPRGPGGLSPRVRGNLRHRSWRLGCRGSIPACAGEPMSRYRGLGLTMVYPRVCGGTSVSSENSGCTQGLSPRVRGNLFTLGSIIFDSRSIPACAGEPFAFPSPSAIVQVYPRVCGGTPLIRTPRGLEPGLSPRVRGNRSGFGRCWPAYGSIPACAGEPCPLAGSDRCRSVYPRVCGGTHPCPILWRLRRGLSPRVRGNHRDTGGHLGKLRSIPACAGEPPISDPGGAVCGVYPRVCGGTPGDTARSAPATGLSPRVRGNRLRHGVWADAWGSIPACAGEPRGQGLHGGEGEVYPRVCGGTVLRHAAMTLMCGLSPRVRGNLRSQNLGVADLGSIPACAGEPEATRWPLAMSRVYPRVCGGTRGYQVAARNVQGLSPRVRGNRGSSPLPRLGGGSIPACAGEPRSTGRCVLHLGVYPRVCGGTHERHCPAIS